MYTLPAPTYLSRKRNSSQSSSRKTPFHCFKIDAFVYATMPSTNSRIALPAMSLRAIKQTSSVHMHPLSVMATYCCPVCQHPIRTTCIRLPKLYPYHCPLVAPRITRTLGSCCLSVGSLVGLVGLSAQAGGGGGTEVATEHGLQEGPEDNIGTTEDIISTAQTSRGVR